MNTPVRPWHLIVIAVGTAAGWRVFTPAPPPPPPDWTAEGFVSVRFVFTRPGGVVYSTASSDDPAVTAAFVAALRDGYGVPKCRCGDRGWVELVRADGTSDRLAVKPPHDEASVEFQNAAGRYRVDRIAFLRAVAPLGLPPERYTEPAPPPQDFPPAAD